MSASALELVRTTIGIRFKTSLFLSCLRTSKPLTLGRFKSSRMRSGVGARACSPSLRTIANASTPSRATVTLFRISASFRASRVRRTSPGLSSTRRISMGVAVMLGRREWSAVSRQSKIECGTSALRRVDPDCPAVALDYLLGDRKANARAGVFLLGVQTLEYEEYLAAVFRRNADAVVAHSKEPVVSARRDRNVDGRALLAPK